MTLEETVKAIVDVLEDKKALDINVINIEEKTILADRFIIASGQSVTHIKTLADEVEYQLKNKYERMPDHIEGYNTGRWVLIDYEDIVVHIFHQEEREFYSLDKLWQHHRG